MQPIPTLRPLADDDLPLLETWLSAPHIAKWFPDKADWLHEVSHRGDSFSFVHHFIAMADGKPVGFCQYYSYADGGEDWFDRPNLTGIYSIDYLVGEQMFLRQGIGKGMILALLEKIRLHSDAKCVIVQPERENAASRAVLRACGFSPDATDSYLILEL